MVVRRPFLYPPFLAPRPLQLSFLDQAPRYRAKFTRILTNIDSLLLHDIILCLRVSLTIRITPQLCQGVKLARNRHPVQGAIGAFWNTSWFHLAAAACCVSLEILWDSVLVPAHKTQYKLIHCRPAWLSVLYLVSDKTRLGVVVIMHAYIHPSHAKHVNVTQGLWSSCCHCDGGGEGRSRCFVHCLLRYSLSDSECVLCCFLSLLELVGVIT